MLFFLLSIHSVKDLISTFLPINGLQLSFNNRSVFTVSACYLDT